MGKKCQLEKRARKKRKTTKLKEKGKEAKIYLTDNHFKQKN